MVINSLEEQGMEVQMAVVRTPSAIAAIKKAYKSNGKLVLTSLKVREGQKVLLESLAKQSGESQAAILRAIIDEWCEMKLSRD